MSAEAVPGDGQLTKEWLEQRRQIEHLNVIVAQWGETYHSTLLRYNRELANLRVELDNERRVSPPPPPPHAISREIVQDVIAEYKRQIDARDLEIRKLKALPS